MRILIAILLGTLLIGCVYKSKVSGNELRTPDLRLAKLGYEILGETSGKGCSFDDPFHRTTVANLKRYASFEESNPVLFENNRNDYADIGGLNESRVPGAILLKAIWKVYEDIGYFAYDIWNESLAVLGTTNSNLSDRRDRREIYLAQYLGVESERDQNPIRKGSTIDQRDAFNIALFKALENLSADALIDVKVDYDEKAASRILKYITFGGVTSNACATVRGTGVKFTGPRVAIAGKTAVTPKKK
ncbi:hypothetical protein A0128_12560 [Leptospira tipperaryensis]|uniref:Lipoprotein n=1 Tax=Leptospira tipperaryensis TaxID=2564040 RepID=A0A1D7UYD1_9LEPT|nr:hypothetical protein [Leptospira tipperaryensis]AOP34606.1 hypothetical protein A0128_12560 [Leptospira tipperaryensis]